MARLKNAKINKSELPRNQAQAHVQVELRIPLAKVFPEN